MNIEPGLRDALLEQSETYDVPAYDLTSLRAAAEQRRRDQRLRYGGLGVVVLLITVGGAMGLVRGGSVDVQPSVDHLVTDSPACVARGEAPPVPAFPPPAHDGFLSDEPVPATPPGGRSCTLVLRYGFHRFGAGSGLASLVGSDGPGLSGMVWLYSDGRLIVDTDQDGFVQWERRLTPAGVERVRRAVVTKLGEPAGRSSDPVRTKISYGAGAFYPNDPAALVRLLIDRSWLPDKYWVTETGSVYQPAWYVVCHPTGGRDSASLAAAVRDLPAGARDMLESRTWSAVPDADGYLGWTSPVACVVLGRADATVLIQALGGDPSAGTAIVDLAEDPATGFSMNALMPNGELGVHGD